MRFAPLLKIACLLVCFAFFVPASVWSFSGGDGTSGNPWQIATVEDLSEIRNYLGPGHADKHFILMADIDLDVAPYNANEGWLPIGDNSTSSDDTRFFGTFDGDGHSISNLFIDRPDGHDVGLFGYIGTGSAISDLQLNGVFVRGGSSTVGSLAGHNFRASISNVGASNVDVAGSGLVGGLIGFNAWQSTLSDSYATGIVVASGNSPVGGLAGENEGTISRCFAEVDVDVDGLNPQYAGGLVGLAYGDIIDAYASGDVRGKTYVGGLVGDLGTFGAANIVRSYATGNVVGEGDEVGGLVGRMASGHITQSFATGDVTGGSYHAGGLVGYLRGGSLADVYATGNVTAEYDYVGGLVGEGTNATITNAYAVGVVRGDGEVGGLVGFPYSGLNVISSYYKEDMTGLYDSTIGVSKALAELQQQDTFADWDFVDVWSINEGVGYPLFLWQPALSPFVGGQGTVQDPYQIATAEQLDAVRDYLDKPFILIADIDLSEYVGGEGWEPIGDADVPFSGSFDGDGHTIANLFIDRPDRDHVGLFGNAENAAFANLNLQVAVIGKSRVGGLVGNLEPGSIDDVHVSGTVVGTANEVGGLAGRIKFADIRSSSADVPISGGSTTYGGGSDLGGLIGNVQNDSAIMDCAAYGSISVNSLSSLRTGGLLGTLWDSTLERSFATGDVVGRDNVGGLIGHSGRSSISSAFATGNVTATANGITNYGGLVGSSESGSTITNAFATGNVSGTDMVGGLIGRQTSDSSVTNSYATGNLVGTTSNVGGLIGINYDGVVASSYYDSSASGQSDTGKGEPKTTAELKHEDTFTAWDFDATWNIIEGATTPYLSWQNYFNFRGTKVQILEGEGEAKAGYLLAPAGDDTPQTRVQSTVAGENTANIEGLQGRWMAVTRAGSSEVRAVAATDAGGESLTWFDVYNAQTETWERASSTLALDSDAFEAGNEILIEEDDADGLQIRIETQVTRELHF